MISRIRAETLRAKRLAQGGFTLVELSLVLAVIGLIIGAVAIGIWAQWMALHSGRRLENPTRFTVQVMMFLTVALYSAAAGLTLWGIAFAIIAIATFEALRRQSV